MAFTIFAISCLHCTLARRSSVNRTGKSGHTILSGSGLNSGNVAKIGFTVCPLPLTPTPTILFILYML